MITHVKKYSIEIGLPLGEATAAAGSIDPNMKYDDVDVGQVTGSEAVQGALNIVRLRQTQCDVDSSTSSVRKGTSKVTGQRKVMRAHPPSTEDGSSDEQHMQCVWP
ncbi:hypothetical protein [Curtobacterium sp. SL109]|uniref:hypothetical protein n=1 Tax=Curtobacterium sp. SL109 TaxID=2994662 RepID=UPI002272FBD1|nr:hypothetical protein [Curtobacterium sp. SL109]MCY1692957.1 hypothetical protein [Curtobacterium sp. SL109]